MMHYLEEKTANILLKFRSERLTEQSWLEKGISKSQFDYCIENNWLERCGPRQDQFIFRSHRFSELEKITLDYKCEKIEQKRRDEEKIISSRRYKTGVLIGIISPIIVIFSRFLF